MMWGSIGEIARAKMALYAKTLMLYRAEIDAYPAGKPVV